MPQKDYLHVTLVSDRSGSMADIGSDAQGSINAFITAQIELDAGLCTLLMYEFDNINTKVFGPDDIKRCPPYILQPRGSTAMLDAIAEAIIDTDNLVGGQNPGDQPEKVIMVIVTDGEENASTQFPAPSGYDQIRKMITDRMAKGWDFQFLAANQDAALAASNMGIRGSTHYAATAASVGVTYTTFTNSVSTLRTASLKGQEMSSITLDSLMPVAVDEDGNAIYSESQDINTA